MLTAEEAEKLEIVKPGKVMERTEEMVAIKEAAGGGARRPLERAGGLRLTYQLSFFCCASVS